MQLVEFIVTAIGTGIVSVGGVKIAEALLRRGGDIGKAVVQGHSRRRIAEVKLTGDAQKDVSEITRWALTEFKAAQDDQMLLHGEIAQLRQANHLLEEKLKRVEKERDVALGENAAFIAKVSDLIAQANDLTRKLAEAVRDKALLEIEHMGAKARIEQQEKLIGEMKQFLDDAHAREARLESENERLRTRG